MSEDDRERTRRRVLATTGTGLALCVAGCASLGSDGGESPTDTATATPTATPTATETATDTEPESPTETDEKGPGYKDYHWHGRLFFEVNGDLVSFAQPKYYLKNIEDEHPDAVYFHFHENDENHAPNEWSNEKKIITLQRGLNLIPGIGYEQQAGKHVVTYEGTTYDARQSGTSITIKEGQRAIDPTSYQVKHDDDYYVQIISEDAKRNATPAHSGADLGTLLFDLNNIRVDFSREKYLGPEAASQAFHFHDDGHPYMWYKEGSVTLAEALNALPGIGYSQHSGSHVIEFQDDQRAAYSRTYDGSASEHEITIKQRTTPIDPTTYELGAGDVIWVYIQSEFLPKNEH